MSTDLNLLFGVLALQADILDARQFVAACSEWAGRKATPLADILVERGWLTPQERALVDQLLERKLNKHDGDAHAGLAAATTPEVRSVLESVADADVRQSLSGMTPPSRPAVFSTTDFEPDSRHRYTRTRLHARGNIGQVWLAHDEDLGRDVALKELRPDRQDNPAAVARFLEEAKVTGQLEHPGILPVYELVQPRDDHPCYAMRFIGRRTLADAVQEYHRKCQAGEAGPLDLRELLAAFVAVCNAVAYAHSRGVLHRDLKPQNVALGDFGEVMVLDWGLAKVVGRQEDQTSLLPVSLGPADGVGRTQPGQVLGTPAYMAPEQAEGRHDRVGKATDVYGLGGILYEILTGEPPFTGPEVPEVLKRVVQEPPVPPRQLVATTPLALQAVCSKALAKEPSDRYESAREFGRDIERWLADEPVLAYREPLRARVGRWARRHRQVTTGLAVLVLTGLVGLGVGLWAVRSEQVRTAHERDLAAANLKLAKQAVDDCFQLAKEHPLLQQENLRQVRKLLLEKALPFYDKFRAQRLDDPQIRAEMADNYGRVGYINYVLGRNDAAERSYVEALRLHEELGKAHPDVPEYQAELAKGYTNLGVIQAKLGRGAEAGRSYAEALRLHEELAKAHPDVPEYQADLAKPYINLGNVQRESGQGAEAEQSYAEARRLLEPLAKEQPEVTEYRADLAATCVNLGLLQQQSGRRAGAERSYSEALPLLEELAKTHPGITKYRAGLAATYVNLGNLQKESGRRGAAEQSYAEALRLLGRLAKDHPEVTSYRHGLAKTYNDLGNVQQDSGRGGEAERSHAEALRLHEELAKAHPDVPAYRADLAATYHSRGNLQLKSGRGADAEQSYAEALRLYEPLAKDHPEVTKYRDSLAATYNNLGYVQQDSGRDGEAERSYGEALRLLEPLAKAHPDVPEYRVSVGGTYVNLGNLRTGLGQTEAALSWYAKGIETLQAAPAVGPNHAKARLCLRNAYEGRANALSLLTRHAEAARDWHRALELDNGPDRPYFRLQRAVSLARAGDHAQAFSEANALAEVTDVNALTLYNAACVCSLASAAVKNDDRYAARAVELLRQAVAKGYKDVEHLKKDPDLDSLRGRDDFKQLLKDLEAKRPAKGGDAK
jgi:serine/threonine-protein kinase